MEFPKLKGRIIEKYGDIKTFSDHLPVSYASVLNKLNGSNDFLLSEIKLIIKLLDINEDEVTTYFFNE